ncbi:tetratricopeptide repeat protein [Spirillospora sp. NPDC127200]
MGPVELWAGERRVDLGTAKERCVLAVLLLAPRRPVPAETLVHRVWGAGAPAKAKQSLYSYITRLRRRLAGLDGVALAFRQGAYVLEVDDEAVDLHRFRLLRDQARAIAGSGDDEYALDRHREAARLWRSVPLAGLSGDWVDRTRRSLEEELLAAAFERLDLELKTGHHADVVGELADLAEQYPFDERPVELLMTALFRSGRQADALAAYRRVRDRLADELGTDPGRGLQELQSRILRNDPTLLRVPGIRLAMEDRRPNNLPPDARAFTGRQQEIRQVCDETPGPVVAIDGMAGVGKTALAVHLAHRLTIRYPDGQIYLKLHAHDPRQDPLDPSAALDTLLRAIGVPAARIPPTLDERAALWRSHLAGGRVLLVLDDAAGHAQVRHLLPGGPGCLVIVTSRRRLSGLHDSHPLSLDVLPLADAVALFTREVGAERALDAAGVTAVVEHCGRLPLAVRIAASRLRHRRTWTVADLLARLASGDRRLAELRVEDTDLTTLFELSYRGLPQPLRAAFRAFGAHPGPDITAHAAAAVLSWPVDEAEGALEELLDRHLITEPVRGRYRFHDLVHDYARHLSRDDGDGAADRVLDHYLTAADRADRTLYPHRRRLPVPIPARALPPLETEEQARQWFTAEHECLLAAAYHAVRADHIALFAHVLAGHLEALGHWDALTALHERAVDSWRGMGDAQGTAQALADLSHIRFRAGDHDAALAYGEEALTLRRAVDDRLGEADVLDHLSLVHWHRARFRDALARSREALDIRRALGDLPGEARSLDHTAIFLDYTGEYDEAERLRERALQIFTETGDARGRAMALNNMGDLALRRGHVAEALRHYAETAAVAGGLGRQHQAIWLINSANVFQHTGRPDQALTSYRRALAIAMELGDRRNEIEALLGVGAAFRQAGRHGESTIHFQKALALSRAIGDVYEECLALRGMGETFIESGRYGPAMDNLRAACALARRMGIPYEVAKCLQGLGDALARVQGGEAAREFRREALDVFERLKVADADRVRADLQDADGATGT